jgi:transposase
MEALAMADFFWFSDEQWSRIEPLLPTGLRGARRVDDRRVLSGIVHALQSGGRWAERGVWQDIFSALAGVEGIPDRLFIDSTCIKVHRTAGGAKGGPWPMVSARHAAVETPRSTPSAT